MGSFIAKQPNGLLCRFSTVVDTLTDINMTEEEYVELCVERAKKEAMDIIKNHLRPFSEVKEFFVPNNHSVKEFNEFLLMMGCEENELLNPDDYG